MPNENSELKQKEMKKSLEMLSSLMKISYFPTFMEFYIQGRYDIQFNDTGDEWTIGLNKEWWDKWEDPFIF